MLSLNFISWLTSLLLLSRAQSMADLLSSMGTGSSNPSSSPFMTSNSQFPIIGGAPSGPQFSAAFGGSLTAADSLTSIPNFANPSSFPTQSLPGFAGTQFTGPQSLIGGGGGLSSGFTGGLPANYGAISPKATFLSSSAPFSSFAATANLLSPSSGNPLSNFIPSLTQSIPTTSGSGNAAIAGVPVGYDVATLRRIQSSGDGLRKSPSSPSQITSPTSVRTGLSGLPNFNGGVGGGFPSLTGSSYPFKYPDPIASATFSPASGSSSFGGSATPFDLSSLVAMFGGVGGGSSSQINPQFLTSPQTPGNSPSNFLSIMRRRKRQANLPNSIGPNFGGVPNSVGLNFGGGIQNTLPWAGGNPPPVPLPQSISGLTSPVQLTGPGGLNVPTFSNPPLDPNFINNVVNPQLALVNKEKFRQILSQPFADIKNSVQVTPQEKIVNEMVPSTYTQLKTGCKPEPFQYQYQGVGVVPTVQKIHHLVPEPFLYKLRYLEPSVQKFIISVMQPEIVENLVNYYKLEATLKQIQGVELLPIEKKVLDLEVHPETVTLQTLVPYIKSSLVKTDAFLPYQYSQEVVKPIITQQQVPGVQVVPEIMKQYGVKIKPFFYSVPSAPALYANPFQK